MTKEVFRSAWDNYHEDVTDQWVREHREGTIYDDGGNAYAVVGYEDGVLGLVFREQAEELDDGMDAWIGIPDQDLIRAVF